MDPEPLSSVEKEAIKESLEDIKHGMVYTLEEVKKELGFIGYSVLFSSRARKDLKNLPENAVERYVKI